MCVPIKTKDVNVKVFNIITRGNKAKTLVKHISWDCEYKFNSSTCNSNQKWSNEKNIFVQKCICENVKYLSIVGTSVMCVRKL